ncbi:uncharacterized protein DUF397 [Haloactinospora alba]|uniref:Uncharacterized protein DUF397 n=1 Tax=Haloactinospora alba TaxID=405555 RepID=A0A543NLJ8_9ACTN|nr:DUF397 domain-containing protein [Haloactinospora alba]TQN32677.1 uncharacterized protein DUF397 [Haloactinospora alba]
MPPEEFRSRANGRWTKSTFSGPNGDCVFVARVDNTVGIIETDDPDESSAPIVLTPLENFRKFLAGAKSGEFDF